MSKSTLSLKSNQTAPVPVNPDLKVRLVELQRQVHAAKPVSAQPPVVSELKPWPLMQQYQTIKGKLRVIAEFKPLAIGVKEALLEMANSGELGVTPAELVKIMGRHCMSGAYLKSLAHDGAYRHDLAGNPIEPVADDHRRYACELLLQRNEKRKLTQKQGGRA